jgi:uncharacterized protein YggT (Ycf19 family)
MLDPLLTRLAVLGFGAIQALLTLRLVMSLADLPRAIMQFEPAVLALSEPLIDPFRRFEDMLHGMLSSSFLGGVDPAVVVALIGWSLVELALLGVLRVLGRGDAARS